MRSLCKPEEYNDFSASKQAGFCIGKANLEEKLDKAFSKEYFEEI